MAAGGEPPPPSFRPRVLVLAAVATAKVKAKEDNKRKLSQGSYQQYYRHRWGNVTSGDDPRISLLKEEWFAGKDYLDVGCNTGKIPWQIFLKFSPRSVVGVDTDKDVIRNANEKLYWAGKRQGLDYTDRLDFRVEDFIADAEDPRWGRHEDESYDVISCLSVTKWVQLNKGDEGVKALFHRVYRLLRPGGSFLLEPQPLKSYKKRRRVSDLTLQNFEAIRLKPDDFAGYLTGEVGFMEGELLGVPQEGEEGFKRPLYRYVKGGSSSKTR